MVCVVLLAQNNNKRDLIYKINKAKSPKIK